MKRTRTETDSSNILLRIKHSVVIIVEKCFGISLHPFLRCLDEEQAQYKPFSHCQYHASVSFEDGNTYHWCFCKGKLLTLVISVWGTGITREMCLGAHISRGNTYHCNTCSPTLHSDSQASTGLHMLHDIDFHEIFECAHLKCTVSGRSKQASKQASKQTYIRTCTMQSR